MVRLVVVIAGLLFGAPSIVGAAPGQAASGGAQKVDPAVAKVREAYVAANKARDAAKVAQLYTEDAVEMPPFQKPLKGRAAIQSYYEKLFKGEQAALSNFQLQSVGSRVAGDVAYDVGTYRQNVTPKGGKAMEDSGNYTVILHRSGEGQWRVAYAIYNSHMPRPGAGVD